MQQQLDSLFNQTVSNFTLLIRDDGSTDSTLQIIKSYQKKHQNIVLIEDDFGNVGVIQNFNLLLQQSNAEFILFCDQDDIWKAEKIEKSICLMQQSLEMLENKAIFLYTNMKTIDNTSILTSSSFWKKHHLSPKYFTLNRLLIQSIAHGCTIAINKNFKDLIGNIPIQAQMHDHYMSLVAVCFATVISVEEPLLQLRNHEQNVSRKQQNFFQKTKTAIHNFFDRTAYENQLQAKLNQAEAFYKQYQNQLKPNEKKTIEQFLKLSSTNGITRKRIYINNKFYRTTLFATLKMLWKA